MATSRKLRIAESPSETVPQTEPGSSTTLMTSRACAVILAFGALWFEFLRNLASLPKALIFWHFHF